MARLDGRTREAALMRQVRKELTAHVGGAPNAIQRMLIERAVILTLRCAQIDDKIMSGELLTTMDNNQGLAWQNSLRRTLVALGVVESATTAQPMDAVAYGKMLDAQRAADG